MLTCIPTQKPKLPSPTSKSQQADRHRQSSESQDECSANASSIDSRDSRWFHDSALLGHNFGQIAVNNASSPAISPGPQPVIQRAEDNKPFWESQWFGTATDLAGYIPGVGGALSVMGHSFDVANSISAASEGNYLNSALSAAKVGNTFAGALAELGGFSLNSAALGTTVGEGLSLPTMAGLTAAGEAGGASAAAAGGAALGPIAAVLGAGLAGVGVGTLIAENTGVDEAIGDGLFDILGPKPGLWLADTFGL